MGIVFGFAGARSARVLPWRGFTLVAAITSTGCEGYHMSAAFHGKSNLNTYRVGVSD